MKKLNLWLRTKIVGKTCFTIFLKRLVIYTVLPSTIMSWTGCLIHPLVYSAETPLETLKTPIGVQIQHFWSFNTECFSVLFLGSQGREFLIIFLAYSWKKTPNHYIHIHGSGSGPMQRLQPELNPWTEQLLMPYFLTKIPWLLLSSALLVKPFQMLIASKRLTQKSEELKLLQKNSSWLAEKVFKIIYYYFFNVSFTIVVYYRKAENFSHFL